jgi:putative membrane protein
LINCVSIFGFVTFVQHPELLSKFSWSIPIFSMSFPFFAQLQIGWAFILAFYFCAKQFGLSSLRLFFSAFFISLAMELCSTTYGFPFGKYSYTELLGWKILGHVPIWIPISWFFMSLASWLLAHQIIGPNRSIVGKILLGALLLLTWDFTLDPAMSQLTPFWLWEQPPNPFLHMPTLNLAGWFLTGCLIMTCFEMQLPDLRAKWKQTNFPIKFYLSNLLLPFGFALVGKLWLPTFVTLTVGLLCFLLVQTLGNVQNFRRGA